MDSVLARSLAAEQKAEELMKLVVTHAAACIGLSLIAAEDARGMFAHR